MPAPFYQMGPRNPLHLGFLAQVSVPQTQDSPAASYDTLVADELLARGLPDNHFNRYRIISQVKSIMLRKHLPTDRLRRIWDFLY